MWTAYFTHAAFVFIAYFHVRVSHTGCQQALFKGSSTLQYLTKEVRKVWVESPVALQQSVLSSQHTCNVTYSVSQTRDKKVSETHNTHLSSWMLLFQDLSQLDVTRASPTERWRHLIRTTPPHYRKYCNHHIVRWLFCSLFYTFYCGELSVGALHSSRGNVLCVLDSVFVENSSRFFLSDSL